MGRPTRIRASNWPIGGSDWPVGGSRTVNRRYWRTGGTRSMIVIPNAASSNRIESENIAIAVFKAVYKDWNGSTTTEPMDV